VARFHLERSSMSESQQQVPVKKSDTAKRMVWAEVYAPDRPDADGEFMRAETIEKMAYDFMRAQKLDAVDSQHDQINKDGCCVVESFIARKGDPDFIEGAWVVGMHVDNDDLWSQIEKGEIAGFSMEAMVIKEPQQVEVDIQPVLAGRTLKSEFDDHMHDFLVAYDDSGKFMGGRTTPASDGHYHVIKSGTVTEKSGSGEGHRHRFSHIEGVKIR
jgi:hypothetical protein